MKKGMIFILILLSFNLAACNMFQKSGLVRVQKQRSAANKYATGTWMDRRDAVKEIITCLGPDKNDLVIGTLMVASKDPYTAVRIEAVKGLGVLNTKEALDVVKKIASEDRDGNVRWYAIKELRSFKDPSIADVYIRGLESDDWLIREESVKGMLSMDDATIKGDLAVAGTATVGAAVVGADGAARGVLTLWDGAGGNTPGYIKIGSPNGTVWYLFVEDDGTVKVHNAAPAANGDGSVVGAQT